jgi:hypothetical protein
LGNFGYRLGMIARRVGRQPLAPSRFVQAQGRITRPAHLEGPDFLEVFALEKQLRPAQ